MSNLVEYPCVERWILTLAIILVLSQWVWPAKPSDLEAEAVEIARQKEFLPAMVECDGLWYIRWFVGYPDQVPRVLWERSNKWVLYELKNIKFTTTLYSPDQSNEPNETDLEWIGVVHMESDAQRAYYADSHSWATEKHPQIYGVELKKRAGQWHIITTHRHIGHMPSPSCKEIAALRK